MDYHRSDAGGGEFDVQPRGVLRRYERSKKVSVPRRQVMEEHTRRLEQEAYRAVVRAFGAQSNDITWTKERVMTDLRKELRVTDEQHREILVALNDDDTIRQLREMMKEAPSRKRGPGRPPGLKRNKRVKVEDETIPAGSGAGVLKKLGDQKTRALSKMQAEESGKAEDIRSLKLDEIEAELAQEKVELSRIPVLRKAVEELKRHLFEEMAQSGLDENGFERMETDTPETQENNSTQHHEEQQHEEQQGQQQQRQPDEHMSDGEEKRPATVKDEG